MALLLQTNENAVSVLLSLLGLDAGSLTGSVGLQCSGISGVGAGQDSCQASPVCCTNNNVVSIFLLTLQNSTHCSFT